MLQDIIDNSSNIVFFGGAGVSTESGLKDFRGQDGLYKMKYEYTPETYLSHSFFYSNTKEFFRFYFDKMLVDGIEPNKAHYKLVELEKVGKLKAIITQNIDRLHQKAGSKVVYELHGNVEENICPKCNVCYDLDYIKSFKGDVPRCKLCGEVIKPDVVLYGEPLDVVVSNKSLQAILDADTLIVVGTSLTVYPARTLVEYFHGRYLVVINKGEVEYKGNVDLYIDGKVGEVLDRIKVKEDE